jgi:hypothetical protein
MNNTKSCSVNYPLMAGSVLLVLVAADLLLSPKNSALHLFLALPLTAITLFLASILAAWILLYKVVVYLTNPREKKYRTRLGWEFYQEWLDLFRSGKRIRSFRVVEFSINRFPEPTRLRWEVNMVLLGFGFLLQVAQVLETDPEHATVAELDAQLDCLDEDDVEADTPDVESWEDCLRNPEVVSGDIHDWYSQHSTKTR